MSFPCHSCLPPSVSTARQLLAGSVSQFQPCFFVSPTPPHLPISLPFSPCLAFFFSCIPIYLSGSLPLGLRCSDGRAFSIIYCAFKSLTSCAVCKRPWFCVRITADTVDKSAVVCNMRQEGFPKMAQGSFLFFLFCSQEIYSGGTSK